MCLFLLPYLSPERVYELVTSLWKGFMTTSSWEIRNLLRNAHICIANATFEHEVISNDIFYMLKNFSEDWPDNAYFEWASTLYWLDHKKLLQATGLWLAFFYSRDSVISFYTLFITHAITCKILLLTVYNI